jgi:aspartate ammonia-lyase
MSQEPDFVKAFGYVKKAAALANRDLGVLEPRIADAIALACDRLIAGEMRDQFVTDFIQGGAGTSTNMNANEVIANLALEILGHRKGEYQFVNPNDHVNFGQSTNDVYPTAFRLALILRLDSYMSELTRLQQAFFAKGREFDTVLKMGRTHLQDAVPMSLGQEFRGWGTTMGEEVHRLVEVRQFLHEINLGATAIGTTVTAAPGYPELATRHLSQLTGLTFILAHDLIEATSDTGAYVLLSGVLKRTSSKLTKICNDIRLLASGPRCGFNEIRLPQMQPGSSIMPGKVNPVIPEVVNQTGFLVIGLDLTVTLAASAGQLQLNVMEPVITYALFTSISTMQYAVESLRVNCVDGITANAEHTRDMVLNSLGIVTVLKPSLGYKQCAEIAREGYETGKSLHQIVVGERKLLTQAQWDEVFSFENLISPKFAQ